MSCTRTTPFDAPLGGESGLDFATSDVEADLVMAARTGVWPQIVWNDPLFIENAQEDGAYTAEGITQGRAQYMAHRQTLLDNLRRAMMPTTTAPSVTAPLVGVVGSGSPATEQDDFNNPRAEEIISLLSALVSELTDFEKSGQTHDGLMMQFEELPQLKTGTRGSFVQAIMLFGIEGLFGYDDTGRADNAEFAFRAIAPILTRPEATLSLLVALGLAVQRVNEAQECALAA